MGHPLFDLTGKSAVVVGGTCGHRAGDGDWAGGGGSGCGRELSRRAEQVDEAAEADRGEGPEGAAADLRCGRSRDARGAAVRGR